MDVEAAEVIAELQKRVGELTGANAVLSIALRRAEEALERVGAATTEPSDNPLVEKG